MEGIVKTYENYCEEERLSTNKARKIEFITTIKAFEENFPAKARILDCAAGTGIYAFYLAEKGYDVTATDLTPRHIDIINKKCKEKNLNLNATVLDATDLSAFDNETFDIVLNMGPMYHLTDVKMRNKNISECIRVLKKGGLLYSSYISRFFIFDMVAIKHREFIKKDLINKILNTGTSLHNDENCFWTDSYYAKPEEMERLYNDNGLKVIDHFAQDGVSPAVSQSVNNMTDDEFEIWCDYHFMVCREKSIIGASNHSIIAGKK